MEDTKMFTEKEVIRLLIQQRDSDSDVVKGEANISGFTAKNKILKNKLVLKNE
jgi:hypothetical protein